MIVKTYDQLIKNAVTLEEGHIEPYLQQLSKFNAIHIEQLRAAQSLSENIAIESLRGGMLKGKDTAQIRERIKKSPIRS
jgi:hypothetical protein